MKKLTLMVALISIIFGRLGRAETIIALMPSGQFSNRLLIFDSATPGTIIRTLNVTGLSSPQHLALIDFRPETGSLYALSYPSCVSPSQCTTDFYTIDYGTGAATRIGSVFNVYSVPPAPPDSFDFDFNPTVDRIRFIDDRGNNIRIDPSQTSQVPTRDTSLAYANTDMHAGQTPNIVGCAYTNNFASAGQTILYDIDSNLDILVYQDPPNSGLLHTVGNLGVDTTGNVGFDISQGTGTAYASLTTGTTTGLYTINLASGVATFIGPIGDTTTLAGEPVLDIAVPAATRLLNVSTRGRVGTGDDVLIGGFISRGGGRVVLRAIGPSLGAFGVASPLPDPLLTLKDSNGVTLASNDDWQSSRSRGDNGDGLSAHQ